MLKLILIFISLTTCNVVVGTIKALLTIKGTKFWAAFMNALAYAINTAAIIYTADEDLPMWIKLTAVASINFIGVYIVKWIEEKSHKAKLWKIECTVPVDEHLQLRSDLKAYGISHSYIEGVGSYVIFNIYSENKEQSSTVKRILKHYGVKYFVIESEIL